MESLCNLFFTSPPPSTLCLHPSPPNPLSYKKHPNSIIKSSSILPPQSQSQSSTPTRIKPPKSNDFAEKDAFPSSLPIHTKNPSSIYRDIQKFARQNKLKEALAILDYLDRRGVPVNPTTFAALIASVVRVRSLSVGKLIHTHIRINGLENNDYLRTKLVHMYTSCGSVEDARKLFDEMPSSSVYPWNALLRGNVIMGGRNHQATLHTFSLMRELGIESNVYTFSCLIKSLGGSSALFQGLKTHGLLIKNGLIGDAIISTSLIDMYFKCGKTNLAHRVFEEIPDEERDIVLWGAMIAGFAHNRLQREALEYLRWMTKDGLHPNSVLLTTILPVIGEVSCRKLGQEVHAYVIKTKEYSKQLFIQSGLIDMYCKCGDMGSGRRVFYGSNERNTITWTALISGYVANGRLEQALRSIVWMQQEGFKPDVVTVATVVPICGKLKALKQGKELHCYAVKNGFIGHISVATSLMMMYAKCGSVGYSCKLFDHMGRRNVIAWTAMIESHIECGCLDGALGVFRSMVASSHRPDSVTTSRVLTVCRELKELRLGKEVHGQAVKRGFDSVPFVSSEIVRLYGSCAQIALAVRVFDAVPVKGSMTWTAVIEAHGHNGRCKEAVDLFDRMVHGGFTPNQFTFRGVLAICEEGGLADEACRVFRLMTRRYKLKPTVEDYSSLIGVLTDAGRTQEAQRFSQLRSAL